VVDGWPSLAPSSRQAEVVTAAKRDLVPGETLDGIGGTTIYGLIEDADHARANGLVPIGLLAQARMTHRVSAGELLTESDVELDETSTILLTRRLQDKMLTGDAADIARYLSPQVMIT
jgi:predicted homoserine dehydrogenase-like protein